MTVELTRTFELGYPCEDVWLAISDHEVRAEAISVVETFEEIDDERMTWYVELPIPFLRKTVVVETVEIEREEPSYVEFRGESSVMDVRGSHNLVELDDGGCEIENWFEVDGHFPGVETFFKSNIDAEIANLEEAYRAKAAEAE